MKTLVRLVMLLLFVFAYVPRALFAQQQMETFKAKPAILVDDDKVQCPKAKFTSIQAAVDAAKPGDSIRVCVGTYAEQVVISKSLTIEGDNGAIVIPNNVTVNGSDIPSGTPVAAVILAKDASFVDIENLIVDGSGNGISECSPDLKGVLFQNTSGVIQHNAVRHIRLSPSFPGCQSGEAIEVESASGLSSTVEIHDNSVWDYQKNGITANEVGTQASIDSNTVTGIGPTTGAGQNGIQVAFGATGSVTGNSDRRQCLGHLHISQPVRDERDRDSRHRIRRNRSRQTTLRDRIRSEFSLVARIQSSAQTPFSMQRFSSASRSSAMTIRCGATTSLTATKPPSTCKGTETTFRTMKSPTLRLAS